MSEAAAVAHAEALFDSGAFFRTLADRVACRTESQNAERAAEQTIAIPIYSELSLEQQRTVAGAIAEFVGGLDDAGSPA